MDPIEGEDQNENGPESVFSDNITVPSLNQGGQTATIADPFVSALPEPETTILHHGVQGSMISGTVTIPTNPALIASPSPSVLKSDVQSNNYAASPGKPTPLVITSTPNGPPGGPPKLNPTIPSHSEYNDIILAQFGSMMEGYMEQQSIIVENRLLKNYQQMEDQQNASFSQLSNMFSNQLNLVSEKMDDHRFDSLNTFRSLQERMAQSIETAPNRGGHSGVNRNQNKGEAKYYGHHENNDQGQRNNHQLSDAPSWNDDPRNYDYGHFGKDHKNLHQRPSVPISPARQNNLPNHSFTGNVPNNHDHSRFVSPSVPRYRSNLNATSHTSQWLNNDSQNTSISGSMPVGQRLTDRESSSFYNRETLDERLKRSTSILDQYGNYTAPVTMSSAQLDDFLAQEKLRTAQGETSSEYRDYNPQQTETRYHRNRMDAERRIKDLSPMTVLQTQMRLHKVVVLTSARASYAPWQDYFSSLLSTCYLQCIALINIRIAPKNDGEWSDLDNQDESVYTRSLVKHAFESGKVPSPSENDSVSSLNAIFVTVCSLYPMVLMTLHALLRASLDDTMKFLRPSEEQDAGTFRAIYFGAHKHFLIDATTQQTGMLMDFMSNTPYKLTESIDAFFKRVLKKAKTVNLEYRVTVISSTMIWEIFFDSIRKVNGTRYDTIIDSFRQHDGFPTKDMDLLVILVEAMQNKYSSRSKFVTNDEFGNYVVNDVNDQSIYYAGAPSSSSGQKPRFGGSTGSKINRPSSELPCFLMKNSGECRYGSKCKYSHDRKILDAELHPSVHAALLEEQLNLASSTMAALHKKHSNFRKKYVPKKGSRPPPSSSPTPRQPGSGNFVSTYQAAVGSGNSANAATVQDSKEPDIDPPDEQVADGASEEDEGLSFSTDDDSQ
jgi:hypothetical protein